MRDRSRFARWLGLVLICAACGRNGDDAAPDTGASGLPPAPPAPRSLPHGLLLALSPFKLGPDGEATAEPDAARLEILLRERGQWRLEVIEDPESNVFHKAMVYDPGTGGPGILTLGGSAAAVKLWRREGSGFIATTLWRKDFGGKHSRMRDAEIGDLLGPGSRCLAVATHDQGVVALLRPRADGSFEVRELDHRPRTFVHEIEIGDLDGDGVPEVYATPSEPNRMDGSSQSGRVMRYVPAGEATGTAGEATGTAVVDLGERHAKEILVDDLDGDGTDELYVSVEGKLHSGTSGAAPLPQVEIRRHDAGTDSTVVIARIPDALCRFLTAGDFDGDGTRELVAAAFRSGLWLLRPGPDTHAPWQLISIDRDSSGFEHATLATDLDGDGTDELYVASDTDGTVRRYVWVDGGFTRETIHRRAVAGAAFTWNIMPVPVELVR